jgi:hypothetical protein
MWKELDKVTTKELQSILKIALNNVSSQDFNTRLGTTYYNKEFIGKFRKQCKNNKLKYIYFRLFSKDVFTMKKLFNYKLVNCDKCSRCGEAESYRHFCLTDVRHKESGKHIMNTRSILDNPIARFLVMMMCLYLEIL